MKLAFYSSLTALVAFAISPALADHGKDKDDRPLQGGSADALAAPPQWYIDDVEFLTGDGGRWVTSNEAYQSEDEPFQSYVLEWKKGYANSMTGRLFGIKDGRETADFWRFRQYWHPGKGRAIVQQFGAGGAMGIGPLWPEDGGNKMLQKFYGPDGSVSETGHAAHNPDASTHITESFTIVDGEWQPSRLYTWKRAARAPKNY